MLVGIGCGPPEPAAPAIVMVVVDTLRADHLGLYGHRRPTSPELDRWAERGLVFERAYSTAAWTLPSVATLLTGRLPSEHGAGEITARVPRRTHARLRAEVATVAEQLASRGWRTGAIVVNPFLEPKYGLDRGFETYQDLSGDRRDSRRARAVVHRAISWLEERRGTSFFLLLHLIDPHKSYEAPRPFADSFSAGMEGDPAPGLIEVREALERGEAVDFEFLRAVYDEEIAYVDHQLAALRDYLDASGLAQSTTVVVTSDHGEEFGEHQGYEHGHALYDEVLRVPLIFWGPKIEPGRRSEPVSLAAVAATLFDAVDIDPMGLVPGSTLLRREPAVERSTAGGDLIVAERMLYGPEQRALVSWPWKFVQNLETGEFRLHDLARDPGEARDLAPEEATRAAEFAALLAGLTSQLPAGEPVAVDEETRERLRALGYLD